METARPDRRHITAEPDWSPFSKLRDLIGGGGAAGGGEIERERERKNGSNETQKRGVHPADYEESEGEHT